MDIEWEYNFQKIHEPRTPTGRLRWRGWIPSSTATIHKWMPLLMIDMKAPTGLVLTGWHWNDKTKTMEFQGADGARHLLRHKRTKP